MRGYFKTNLIDIGGDINSPRAFGAYDVRNSEYVLAVTEGFFTDALTIAFSERQGGFSSFFTYKPEFMFGMPDFLTTFKDGVYYTHGESVTYAYFGVTYNSSLSFVSNIEPFIDKDYLAMIIDGSIADATVTVTTPAGQEANMFDSDFDIRRNEIYLPIVRDINTPNLTSPVGISSVDGDIIADRTALIEIVSITPVSTDIIRKVKLIVGV
jgi:hypothetical protein